MLIVLIVSSLAARLRLACGTSLGMGEEGGCGGGGVTGCDAEIDRKKKKKKRLKRAVL